MVNANTCGGLLSNGSDEQSPPANKLINEETTQKTRDIQAMMV